MTIPVPGDVGYTAAGSYVRAAGSYVNTTLTIWGDTDVTPNFQPQYYWVPSNPPKEQPVAFNATKFVVMTAGGSIVGFYDSDADAVDAAEQHAEKEGQRAYVLAAVKVAKPMRRDVKTESV